MAQLRMTRFVLSSVLAVSMVAVVALVGSAGDEPAHAFIGAAKCKMCHNSAKKGAQFSKWQETKHSKAYETLASEEAKKVAADRGIADPQKAPECLKCHVTGHGAPAELLTQKYAVEEGVGCESCHGPGADYSKMSTMKDRDLSVAAGLVIPDASTCIRCHNEESPFYKPFDFEKSYSQIAHEYPEG